MMTRKNILYLSIIAVGLVALAVDRLAFNTTGPAIVEGAEPVTGESAGARHVAGGGVKSGGASDAITLSRPFPPHLPDFSEETVARDIFAPPGAPRAASAPDPAAATPGKGVMTLKDFASHHRLDGTLVGGAVSVAIVDGRRLRVGAELDGFTLLEIGASAVVFGRDDDHVTLTVRRALEIGTQP